MNATRIIQHGLRFDIDQVYGLLLVVVLSVHQIAVFQIPYLRVDLALYLHRVPLPHGNIVLIALLAV